MRRSNEMQQAELRHEIEEGDVSSRRSDRQRLGDVVYNTPRQLLLLSPTHKRRTIPERNRRHLPAAFAFQPDFAQDLAEANIEENTLAICESYAENIDGGRLGEGGDGGGGGEERSGVKGVDEGAERRC